jgi:hypothetical protein
VWASKHRERGKRRKEQTGHIGRRRRRRRCVSLYIHALLLPLPIQ